MLHLSLSAVHYLSLTLLTSLAFQRWMVLVRSFRLPHARLWSPTARDDSTLPLVEVHLPLYNESQVACRVIAATRALDWPSERLVIRVLDDSDDETPAQIDAFLGGLPTTGPRVHHERRASRRGYKAGALAEALQTTEAEWIAIFDADFLPPSDFLRQTVPLLLHDSSVGMVQARWGHLNAEMHAMTRAQRVLLEGHFRLEQATRAHFGTPFNFNGTAGVWRTRALHDAGGWQSDTLTEDLDISYRAQLAGWRFAYLDALQVPAELPSDMESLLSQQRRWAKGGTQTALKLWWAIVRHADMTWRTRWEATTHLWSNLSYIALAIVMFTGPILIFAPQERWLPAWVDLTLFLAGGLGVILYLARSAHHHAPRATTALLQALQALMLDIGLTPQKAHAVFEALIQRHSPFVRTPKRGASIPDIQGANPHVRGSWRGGVELILAAAHLAATVHVLRAPDATLVLAPILLLIGGGLAWVGALRCLGSTTVTVARPASRSEPGTALSAGSRR